MFIINLVGLVVAVGLLIFAWIKGKKEIVKSILLQAVIKAEEYFAKGENEAKENFVLDILAGYTKQIWLLK